MESIEFECPYCQRISKVPLSFAGRQGKCPSCKELIEVPDPASFAPPPVPAAASDAPTVPVQVSVSEKSEPEASADERRPCPQCGEAILAAAKKCRFCGEFLDEQLRRKRRGAMAASGLEDLDLATPGRRLTGYLVDVIVLRGIPGYGMGVAGAILADSRRTEGIGAALIGMAFLWYFGVTFLQWFLVAKYGQTLGKRWLGMKIVRTDGTPLGFLHGVVLRNWITGIVGSFFLSWLGCLFRVVDSCLVFSNDRRCLHDHIGSTCVINVDKGGGP